MIPSVERAASNLSLFEEHLKSAQLFIVVFGAVPRERVQHRLIEAHKIILLHGLSTRIGVYVAPPSKSDDMLKFPYDVAINSDRFDPDGIEPLLEYRSMSRV